MSFLTFLGAVVVGLSLGLTGAGGSIITLPVLVYLGGLAPREAVGVSLFVVGVAALVGAGERFRAGEFHGRAAVLFALSGMAGAAGGARLTPLVSGEVLMVGFAGLMVLVAVRLLREGEGTVAMAPECRPWRCLAAGFGVGVLTGFIGVGGGFLLMPSLVKFARLPLRVATGTSLAVIAFNAAAGFWSHCGEAPPRWPLALLFAGVAALGVVVGTRWAGRLPVVRLRQGFAAMVLATGVLVLWQNLR